jgi:hypothetical protein
MDASTQRLSCAQDTIVFPENGDCIVEPGTLLIRIFWLLDKITFTYLFVSVILSNSETMSRGTTAPKFVVNLIGVLKGME